MDRPTNPLFDKNVYLSGPMAGMPDLNREAFAAAEELAYGLGARYVFNPREHWGHTDRAPEWYMRHDLHALVMEKGDGHDGPVYEALVALPGSELSKGARCEALVARLCGIEVVRYSDLLGVGA